jgi:hypothetical protein
MKYITLGEICNTLRVVWGDAKRVEEGFSLNNCFAWKSCITVY